MTTTPTPLPGMPDLPVSDYETWEAEVRPTFEQVAAAGESFVCWRVAQAHRLPDPPERKRDWARLISGLHNAGVIRQDGYGHARDGSAVCSWRGTRQARRAVAA
jgi:hypothetical protein